MSQQNDTDFGSLDTLPPHQRSSELSNARRGTTIDRRAPIQSNLSIEDQLTIRELYNVIHNLELQMHGMSRRLSEIKTAFVANDLQKPDYDGHRKEHLQLKENKKTVDGYKAEIAKKILGGLGTFIAGIITAKMSGWI